jgi:5-methylthioadenosine/S-adenosylhomocysteine deaminase
MDMLAKIQKLHSFSATALPAEKAITCATVSGARLLGLEMADGLSVGSPADIVLLDLNTAHLTPFYNPDLLVYAARGSDVSTVIVNGRIVVKNREILSFDLQETCSQVRKIAGKLARNKG